MNGKEIRSKIGFTRRPMPHRQTMWTGTLQVQGFLVVSDAEQVPETEIHRRVSESILREVWDYEQQELYRAIMDLKSCQTFDYSQQEAAIDGIIMAARKQLPK